MASHISTPTQKTSNPMVDQAFVLHPMTYIPKSSSSAISPTSPPPFVEHGQHFGLQISTIGLLVGKSILWRVSIKILPTTSLFTQQLAASFPKLPCQEPSIPPIVMSMQLDKLPMPGVVDIPSQ